MFDNGFLMCYYLVMENIKQVVKDNLIKLRKENKLTQLELSQKVGYSDKAISRWETGETTPDVETLNVLAELYNVPISYFFEETHEALIEEKKVKERQKVSKLVISLLCIVSVWFVAIIVFDVLNKFVGPRGWLAFIWAIPASLLLAIIFNAIWGKKIWTLIFASAFSWTLLLALHLQLIKYSSFMLFILGVPVQVVLILAFLLKQPNIKIKRKEKNTPQ